MDDRATTVGTAGDKRRTRRAKVFIPTELVVADVPVRAHLLDLSAAGSRVHTGAAQPLGTDAYVNLNGEAHEATVRWTDAGCSGLEFKAALSPEQVAAAIKS